MEAEPRCCLKLVSTVLVRSTLPPPTCLEAEEELRLIT